MKILKVLIACEESQTVCKAFRELGHEAYSNDLQDCSGGHPEWHLKMDVFEAISKEYWDLMIAHPPCTHLAVSGARWFKEKQTQQEWALKFVQALMDEDIKFIVIENPISIISTRIRKPDQIIQPWQFGHPETKATCLWIKNLPKLKLTNVVSGREQRIWKLPPGPERAKLRSKTFPGIAKAMAEQWSKYILEKETDKI